jgi:hypothetical protein
MPPNQAKIVLKNPCSENWDSMHPDAAGRFCQSCQKSVIDFSLKTDHEIQVFLKDKQGEALCGRFYIHQVERIRIEIDQKILVSNIPFWQKFLAVVLVCFGPDLIGYHFVFAQTETDSIPIKTEQVDSLNSITVIEQDSILQETADSVITERLKFKPNTSEWSCESELIPTIGFVMGNIITTYVPLEYPDPERVIPFNKYQATDDTQVNETGIVQSVSKKDPMAPKHPPKKPSPPENAVIADSNDRRKTQRI